MAAADNIKSPQNGPVRTASLELLARFDEVCRKEGIRYTLIGETLLGQVHLGGFLPCLPPLEVALLYDDYLRVKCALQEELAAQSAYYLLDAQNSEHFDVLYCALMKRSGVTLGAGRERDEKHYDYALNIYPLYYAGDTHAAAERFAKACGREIATLQAHPVSRDVIRPKYWQKALRHRWLCARRTKDTFAQLERIAAQHKSPTKYVYLPHKSALQGAAALAATYGAVRDATFCAESCMVVENAQQWLRDTYSPEQTAALLSAREIPLRAAGPVARRKLQLIQADLLKEIDRICGEHGITYAIAFGTVLGALRHKGAIPWDDDADTVMPYADYCRFIEIASRELDKEKFFLRTMDSDPDDNIGYAQLKRQRTVFIKHSYEKYDTHPGVPVDIFPLFNASRNPFFHALQAAMCRYYRVALWAHMGAENETRPFWRKVYSRMARMGNKKAYAKFLWWATRVKKETGKYLFLGGAPSRIPYFAPYIHKAAYENMGKLEYEGHMFYAAHAQKETMEYFYSKEYLRYPPPDDRYVERFDGSLELDGNPLK